MSDTKTKTGEITVDFGRNPFELKLGEPVATLKLIGDLSPDLAKEFDRRLRPHFEGFASDLVIDFTETGTIHTTWIRPLMGLVTQTKKSLKRVRVVSKNPDHKAFLQDQGVAANFPVVTDMATAVRELTDKKPCKLDVEFINPFLEGAVEILKRQAGVVAKPGHPGARDTQAALDGDISGVIALQSETFSGAVIITFPEATYLKVVSRMLGESHEAINDENRDGASELANQIFGFAKRILNDHGHRIQLAIPAVVCGRTPTGLPATTGPRIVIPFESDAGAFAVEIRV